MEQFAQNSLDPDFSIITVAASRQLATTVARVKRVQSNYYLLASGLFRLDKLAGSALTLDASRTAALVKARF